MQAWRLRLEGKITQLVDPSLNLQTDEEFVEVQRLLNIAFLCIQVSADKRPHMASVVGMLQGGLDAELAELTRLREAQTRLENQFDCCEAAVLPGACSLSTSAFTRSLRGSQEGLLGTRSESTEMPDIEWIR